MSMMLRQKVRLPRFFYSYVDPCQIMPKLVQCFTSEVRYYKKYFCCYSKLSVTLKIQVCQYTFFCWQLHNCSSVFFCLIGTMILTEDKIIHVSSVINFSIFMWLHRFNCENSEILAFTFSQTLAVKMCKCI
jgi:hypothetical protein